MKLGRLLSVHHSMSLQTGQILDGKYRIIRELGSGAMGAL
jgi:hypothetical protein